MLLDSSGGDAENVDERPRDRPAGGLHARQERHRGSPVSAMHGQMYDDDVTFGDGSMNLHTPGA
jgi:hypothetical protein